MNWWDMGWDGLVAVFAIGLFFLCIIPIGFNCPIVGWELKSDS